MWWEDLHGRGGGGGRVSVTGSELILALLKPSPGAVLDAGDALAPECEPWTNKGGQEQGTLTHHSVKGQFLTTRKATTV